MTLLGWLELADFPQPEVARCLSPNGRSSWFVRHKVRVRVEERVWAEAKRQGLPKMRGLVVMRPTLVYPVARKRDDDNAATGVMKVVRDALAKGGWIEADDTDHLRQEPVEIRVERGKRSLELTFETSDVAPEQSLSGTVSPRQELIQIAQADSIAGTVAQ